MARAVSAVGDYASAVALPLIALTLIHDARVLGAALAAERVPVMLAPWWTQRLPEAWRQPRRLPVIGALQSAAAAVLPAGVWVGDLDEASGVAVVSVILMVALTLGTFDALGDALGFAALCELGELRAGDGTARLLGLDDLAGRTAKLAGPALAAALAVAWSPAAVLAFDSASFLLAALLTAWATRILVPSQRRPRQESVVHPRSPATATLRSSRRLPRLAPEPVRRMLARHPQVAASWRLRGIGCFVWGGYSVGMPLLVVAIPGPDTTQLAVIASAYATAGLTGSAAISVRPIEPKHLLAAAMLAWSIVGCCFIAMAAGASLSVLSAAAAVMGLSIPMANVTTTQQVAAATSGPERTLAMMTQSSVVNGASTAGLLVTGAAITVLGPRPTLTCGGLIVLTAALLADVTRLGNVVKLRWQIGVHEQWRGGRSRSRHPHPCPDGQIRVDCSLHREHMRFDAEPTAAQLTQPRTELSGPANGTGGEDGSAAVAAQHVSAPAHGPG
jgi:hypothetical protein